ncbi:MAG TPA: hypothetical protein VJP58_08050 [Candidatus Nitrosocosmicus sp.]|nr:hypothetical protein [Candidatus Nitrosocosmicus sp.]
MLRIAKITRKGRGNEYNGPIGWNQTTILQYIGKLAADSHCHFILSYSTGMDF